MIIPEKGKAVEVTLECGEKAIMYSMGDVNELNRLRVSSFSNGYGYRENVKIWREVEITPVVHAPEDMKPVYVWDDIKPAIPHLRLSAGKVNKSGMLECYMPTEKGPTSMWRHWEEI